MITLIVLSVITGVLFLCGLVMLVIWYRGYQYGASKDCTDVAGLATLTFFLFCLLATAKVIDLAITLDNAR